MSIKKYVITGHILEVYTYEKFVCGYGGKTKEDKKENEEELKKEVSEKILENYSNHNVVRSNMIRRLACSNFNNKSLFVTLTFDDKKVSHDIRNVQECNLVFKNFIKRLKRFLKSKNLLDRFNVKELKYLAVIEFQDKSDRRAVHYHVLFNIPFISNEDLERIWGQGFIYLENIKHVDNVGAYLIKYMTKDNEDDRLMGENAYLRSKNLIEPEEIILLDSKLKESNEYVKLDTILSTSFPTYEAEYDTEFMGKCTYKQYKLERK